MLSSKNYPPNFHRQQPPPIGNKPFFFAGFLKIFGAES
ncbi:hypothetical protein LEP1GSC168_1131 [Leptospira santarosai str. HAI134]|nr:hypothetical protein LEP1GSC168_1131 [Leptospira santarosai str. HAI134]